METTDSRYNTIMSELAAGDTLLLDGATGTELQKRGATMAEAAWCALATESSPDILYSVHQDYILAGARVITANTFASTQQVLRAAGEEHRFASLNRRSVEIAVRARDETTAAAPVLVAGSVSPHKPGQAGNPNAQVDAARFEDECHQMVEIHKQAGCDIILAEMMGDPILSPCVIRAAKAHNLPVWTGFAFRPNNKGKLGICSDQTTPWQDVLAPIIETGSDVFGVMHTRAQYIDETLRALQLQWSGPLMVYPDDIPFRQSVKEAIKLDDVIEEQQFVNYSLGWKNNGVQLLGGCCGLGVTHIRALATGLAGSDNN